MADSVQNLTEGQRITYFKMVDDARALYNEDKVREAEELDADAESYYWQFQPKSVGGIT